MMLIRVNSENIIQNLNFSTFQDGFSKRSYQFDYRNKYFHMPRWSNLFKRILVLKNQEFQIQTLKEIIFRNKFLLAY